MIFYSCCLEECDHDRIPMLLHTGADLRSSLRSAHSKEADEEEKEEAAHRDQRKQKWGVMIFSS